MRNRLKGIRAKLRTGSDSIPATDADWMIGKIQRQADEIDELHGVIVSHEKCIKEARIHVFRQQHGKHEQDRIDAAAWLKKYGSTGTPKLHNHNRAPWVKR